MGAHAIVVEAEIRVADATAGDFDDDLSSARDGFKIRRHQWFARSVHQPTYCFHRRAPAANAHAQDCNHLKWY